MKYSFSDDFIQFFEVLNEFSVKFLIVGGEAVVYYGYPRLTGDIDIFYEDSGINIQKLYKALLKFWDNSIPGNISTSDLTGSDVVVQFGVPPNRIDLMNSISGVTFQEAWESKTTESIIVDRQKIELFYIGIDQLKKNKAATARNKDLDDLEFLNSI